MSLPATTTYVQNRYIDTVQKKQQHVACCKTWKAAGQPVQEVPEGAHEHGEAHQVEERQRREGHVSGEGQLQEGVGGEACQGDEQRAAHPQHITQNAPEGHAPQLPQLLLHPHSGQ